MLFDVSCRNFQDKGIVRKVRFWKHVKVMMAGVFVAGDPCPSCGDRDFDFGMFYVETYFTNPLENPDAVPYSKYRACYKCVRRILPKDPPPVQGGDLTLAETGGDLTLSETGQLTSRPKRENT